jgi:gamma-butyrobetaine dioxygenase
VLSNPDLVGVDPALVGLVPGRTDDPSRAAELVASDGAAILTGWPVGEDTARGVATALFGDRVRTVAAPAAVREGGEGDRLHVAASERLPLHADGFAYGDKACDMIFLICVEQGALEGASFLADAVALLAALPDDLRVFLTDVPVDLTEPGMRAATSPIALTLANGRTAVRCSPFMSPAPGTDPAEHAGVVAMLDRWRNVTWDLTPLVPRFALEPGDALCVDNYRMMHGRDGYAGHRFLWRVWAWTAAGNGVPDGLLHSDSRYAGVGP